MIFHREKRVYKGPPVVKPDGTIYFKHSRNDPAVAVCEVCAAQKYGKKKYTADCINVDSAKRHLQAHIRRTHDMRVYKIVEVQR